MSISSSAYPQVHGDGQRVEPSGTVARVTLRPVASSLPLGAFALVPAGLLLSGMQLGWFAQSEAMAVAIVVLAFAVPLQLVSSVFAFLGRDTLVATSFGIFSGIWLSYGLVQVTGAVGQTSSVLGVFFLACSALFVMLMAGGVAGGKTAAGAVILAGATRFLLSGLYELTESTGVEHAAGIVGLVFVAVALYVGVATLLEDSAHRSILPIGRRGRARSALEADLHSQLEVLEHEAGVRDQL